MRPDVSALILAGGRATRLGGVDKRELVVEGRTIFERQLAVLLPRLAEIIVSSPKPIPGYRTVTDVVADAGPLSGIAAGVAAAATPWLFVVAGDMPYIDGPFVDLVLSHLDDADTLPIDAVGIRIGGLPEPLVCVLRCATCAPVLAARLARGDRKASRLLTDGELRVRWIEEPVLRAVDPELRALFNVNTPDDLTRSGRQPK
ncbi:MAG TPA: molybdenum cofactor guanylyltransferase [Kofleriaceae bacterium]|nr:molybdenum cofactor guanylyltransferase [Kofleriaceae bacterium]